ncbi:unnamed protein product, partial [Didymodactylos carnosus]
MATARTTTRETNEIYNDSESDSELEVENESKSSEDSDPDTESEMEVSDSENTLSLNNWNRISRSWQKVIFRPKLFNFQ